MSLENVAIVRNGYEKFRVTGRFVAELATPDFVWDMSNFRGWPEQQVYEGPEGAQSFIEEWSGAWDDWELEVDALHDVGEQVVAVWTLTDGKQTRMEMYSDRSEALKAAGLPG
jgi:hypothetical protein